MGFSSSEEAKPAPRLDPTDCGMGLKPLSINKFVDVTWHLTITSAPTVVRPKESRGRKGGTKKWHALTGAGS